MLVVALAQFEVMSVVSKVVRHYHVISLWLARASKNGTAWITKES
jgi:hypothetical protein